MRAISLSITLLAGSIMSGLGVIADGLPNTRMRNPLEEIGLTIVILSLILLITECYGKQLIHFNNKVSNAINKTMN